MALDPNADLDARRAKVRATTIDVAGVRRPAVNGIDAVEVTLHRAADPADDLAVLTVEMLHPLDGRVPRQPAFFTSRDVTITGGERITEIEVLSASIVSGGLEVVVAPIGDTSTYTLHLRNADGWLDPVFESIPFSFAIDCPTRFDCLGGAVQAGDQVAPPPLDHLARDFASLRTVLFDRMAVTAPWWAERNPADLGVALVELVADAGDRLSYQQDVVATEAYVATARSRTSVARHLRLVDLRLDDGQAARVAVHATVAAPVEILVGARVWDADGAPAATADPEAAEAAWRAGATIFEASTSVACRPAHNEIRLHTWDGLTPVLPAGSTSVALVDRHRAIGLAPGDLLVVEEVLDPRFGTQRQPDPERRHLVRVTAVELAEDPVADPATGTPLPLYVVEWAARDALPFDLPLVPDPRSGLDPSTPVAAARGNVFLADHHLTLRRPIELPPVPQPAAHRPRTTYRPTLPVPAAFTTPLGTEATIAREAGLVDELDRAVGASAGPILRARLADLGVALERPVLHRTGPTRWSVVDTDTLAVLAEEGNGISVRTMPLSAAACFVDLARSEPAVALHQQETDEVELAEPSRRWTPAVDLLGSSATDQAFVVEVDTDGRQSIRFGDDDHGARPNAGTRFLATVRTGGGRRGNVGADVLTAGQFGVGTQVGTTDRVTVSGPPGAVTALRNPLPARGGSDPEPIADALVRIPEVFANQLRAVTLDDYARWLEQHPRVQRAVVTRRWTGSWYTLFGTVDLVADPPRPARAESTARPELDAETEAELMAWVERRRTIAHDVEIDGPLYVPIELHLCVAVEPTASRRDVERDLRARLGSGRIDASTVGMFHPDARSFGDPVALSQIYQAAQGVPGVIAVEVRSLRRQGSTDELALTQGILGVGRREIVELANDPDHPERGTLTIDVEGGR